MGDIVEVDVVLFLEYVSDQPFVDRHPHYSHRILAQSMGGFQLQQPSPRVMNVNRTHIDIQASRYPLNGVFQGFAQVVGIGNDPADVNQRFEDL